MRASTRRAARRQGMNGVRATADLLARAESAGEASMGLGSAANELIYLARELRYRRLEIALAMMIYAAEAYLRLSLD
jgi:hypothetical protein